MRYGIEVLPTSTENISPHSWQWLCTSIPFLPAELKSKQSFKYNYLKESGGKKNPNNFFWLHIYSHPSVCKLVQTKFAICLLSVQKYWEHQRGSDLHSVLMKGHNPRTVPWLDQAVWKNSKDYTKKPMPFMHMLGGCSLQYHNPN